MKLITERTAIATTINYHKFPVITFDLGQQERAEYGIESCPVLIDTGRRDGGNPHYVRAHLWAFTDEDKFKFTQGCLCIHSWFGYEDVREMLEWRNAPIVKPDEDIIIACYNSKTKEAYGLMQLHTCKKLDEFCEVPLEIADEDYSTRGLMKAAGCELKPLYRGPYGGPY